MKKAFDRVAFLMAGAASLVVAGLAALFYNLDMGDIAGAGFFGFPLYVYIFFMFIGFPLYVWVRYFRAKRRLAVEPKTQGRSQA